MRRPASFVCAVAIGATGLAFALTRDAHRMTPAPSPPNCAAMASGEGQSYQQLAEAPRPKWSARTHRLCDLSRPLPSGTALLQPETIRRGALDINPTAVGAIYLAYMTPAEAARRFSGFPGLRAADPTRPIYLVTMPTDNSLEGGPGGPPLANFTTLIVDAATGLTTDGAMGARWLTHDGDLPRHPTAP